MKASERFDKIKARYDDGLPFMVSFSGGRTSGYLLRIMLDNFDRDRLIVCYANTGKEAEETLEFIHNVETRWDVPINWIEYEPEGEPGRRFRVVDFETASRNGEPFAKLIEKRSFCPNPVARFCTSDLKVKPIKGFIKSLGLTEWDNCIGIRADEPRRVLKLKSSSEKEPYESIAPLYELGVTLAEVENFWEVQPFKLELPQYLGNCDMCFLKSRMKLRRIIREQPWRVDWWEEQEKKVGGTFRNGLPYSAIRLLATTQPELFDDESEIDCLCNVD